MATLIERIKQLVPSANESTIAHLLQKMPQPEVQPVPSQGVGLDFQAEILRENLTSENPDNAELAAFIVLLSSEEIREIDEAAQLLEELLHALTTDQNFTIFTSAAAFDLLTWLKTTTQNA